MRQKALAPADADPEDDTNWISNSYIKTKLKVAKANNIFLIVDSVFRAPSLAVFLSTKKLMISLLLERF